MSLVNTNTRFRYGAFVFKRIRMVWIPEPTIVQVGVLIIGSSLYPWVQTIDTLSTRQHHGYLIARVMVNGKFTIDGVNCKFPESKIVSLFQLMSFRIPIVEISNDRNTLDIRNILHYRNTLILPVGVDSVSLIRGRKFGQGTFRLLKLRLPFLQLVLAINKMARERFQPWIKVQNSLN